MHGAETLPWALPLGLGSSSSCLFLVPPCWTCFSVSSSFHFCYPFLLHIHSDSALISVPLSSVRIEQKIWFKVNHMVFDDLFNSSCTTSIEWPPLFCPADSLLAFSMNLDFYVTCQSLVSNVFSLLLILLFPPLLFCPIFIHFVQLYLFSLSQRSCYCPQFNIIQPKWVLHILVLNSCQCTCVCNLYTIDSVDHYLGQTHWGVNGKSVKEKKKTFRATVQ